MKTQTDECLGDKRRRHAPKVRVVTELSERFSKRLTDYALVAGAAGIGLLGTAAPGKADIVYTKADIPFGTNSAIPIDLNHDGIADFTIFDFGGAGTGSFFGYRFFEGSGHLSLGLNNRNSVLEGSGGLRGPKPLPAGYRIGPTGKNWYFASRIGMGQWSAAFPVGTCPPCSSRRFSSGYWAAYRNGPTSGFLGLRFLINGQLHYGWADLEVQADLNDGGYSGTLIGYAYDTVANQPILAGESGAPEPGTLGLLALGWLGLGFWRPKKPGQKPETRSR